MPAANCTHIKVNGVRCGSPALRGEVFCYFHQRLIRGVTTPPKSRVHPIAILESKEGIQVSIMEVINALLRNTIDSRRAQLVLRALHIAQKNSVRTSFSTYGPDMVLEVPNYPAAPAPARMVDEDDDPPPQLLPCLLQQACVLAAINAPPRVSPIILKAAALATVNRPKPATSAPLALVPAAPKPALPAAPVDPTRPKPPASVQHPTNHNVGRDR
jgi:hypothetical protein